MRTAVPRFAQDTRPSRQTNSRKCLPGQDLLFLNMQTSTSLQRILGLWDYLVDRRVGIISEIRELPIEEDDPQFFHYFSRACDTSAFSPLKNFSHNGGVSTNRIVAIAKAMGEAVERYCSAIFNYADLQLADYQTLCEVATHPRSFALYRLEQFTKSSFPWRPFEVDSPVTWARGTVLRTGDPILVPAAMVYAPYVYSKTRKETPIQQPISTGLACGCSFEEAAVSALCEVIERDAFMLTWQLELNRPVIEPTSVPPSCKQLLRRFHDVDLEVQIVDITTDINVPTFATVAISHAATSPAIAVAAATDPSREVALIKSLEELAHTRKYAKQVMLYTPAADVDIDRGHPDVVDQRTHLRFYCPQTASQYARFLWSSHDVLRYANGTDLRLATKAEELANLVSVLVNAGLEPLICDVTTSDIRDLGLFVLRAIIPGMHPLFMGYKNRALGGQRLYNMRKKMSNTSDGKEFGDNPFPHPFP
jgi:ribosomal protein S12 methylthiotransferase accessory factor